MLNKKLQTFNGENLMTYHWAISGKPKGVVQLIHGSLEHAYRYNELAQVFNKAGFVVIGIDARGHGLSTDQDWGHTGDKVTYKDLIKDLIAVNQMIQKTYPDLPIVIYGHSWGSFLARVLIVENNVKVDAAIISGSSWKPPFIIKSAMSLVKVIKFFKGKQNKYSPLIDWLIFKNFNKKFKQEHPLAWLSNNIQECEKFASDPLKAKMFSLAGTNVLFGTFHKACQAQTFENTAKTLPHLIVSGANDPVGDYGKGVNKYLQLLKKYEINNVTSKLYEDQRHEVHNDLKKQDLFNDLTTWLTKQIA